MAESPRDVPVQDEYQPPAIVRLGSTDEITGAVGDAGSLTVDDA